MFRKLSGNHKRNNWMETDLFRTLSQALRIPPGVLRNFQFLQSYNLQYYKILYLQNKDIFHLFFFFPSRAAPTAYGGSQARGLIWATSAAYATVTATQDLSCIFDLHHSSQQCHILNSLSETRDRTCNLMVPSQICSRCTTMGTISLLESCNSRF